MLLRLLVELAYGNARPGAYRALLLVHFDIVHGREIKDQAAFGACRPGDVVAAAAHRQEQVVLAGEVHGLDHVLDGGAPGDERGTTVDHAVPE